MSKNTLSRRCRRDRSGSNTLEFALTLPIFIGMMFVIIDFGWYFANKAIFDIAVHSGCREGALVDPLTGTHTSVAQNEVQRIVSIIPQACSVNCDIEIDTVGVVPSRSVRCRVSADFQPMVGFNVAQFGYGLPSRLNSMTQMRFEWQRTE